MDVGLKGVELDGQGPFVGIMTALSYKNHPGYISIRLLYKSPLAVKHCFLEVFVGVGAKEV